MQMEELFRIALGLESPWSTCCSTSWTSAPPLQPDDLPTQNSEEAAKGHTTNEDVACVHGGWSHEEGGRESWRKLLLGDGDRYKVVWDTAAAVTPMGWLAYFPQYLSAGDLWIVGWRTVRWGTAAVMRQESGR